MPEAHLEALYLRFPAAIAEMPADDFTSHEFILEFAKRHQREYVEALNHYRERNPFQNVHRIMSQRLRKHENLVSHTGGQDSFDIFGNPNGCASWRRLQPTLRAE